MTIIIKKGTPKEKVKSLLNPVFSKSSKIDLAKYSGILKTNIDALDYQKEMRDEWK